MVKLSMTRELLVARELAPAGLRSGPILVYDGFAAEREQAPSPQNLRLYAISYFED